jgi:hypothetical protein
MKTGTGSAKSSGIAPLETILLAVPVPVFIPLFKGCGTVAISVATIHAPHMAYTLTHY